MTFSYQITRHLPKIIDIEKANETLTIEAQDAVEAGIAALDLLRRSKVKITNVTLQVSIDENE